MTNTQEQERVLSRSGARVLEPEELNNIRGAANTNVCSINPITNTLDGECA